MIKLWEKIYCIACTGIFIYLISQVNHPGEALVVLILTAALLIPVIVLILERIKDKVDAKNSKINKAILANRELREKELTEKFGIAIISKDSNKCDHSFRIYQESKIILINDFDYPFSLLRGCKLHSSGQTAISKEYGQSKSSTGSLLGRTIVGGVLGGGVGAIIGGTTGTKNQKSTTTTTYKSEYTVVITFDDLKNPTKILNCCTDLEFASELTNAINLIVENSAIC